MGIKDKLKSLTKITQRLRVHVVTEGDLGNILRLADSCNSDTGSSKVLPVSEIKRLATWPDYSLVVDLERMGYAKTALVYIGVETAGKDAWRIVSIIKDSIWDTEKALRLAYKMLVDKAVEFGKVNITFPSDAQDNYLTYELNQASFRLIRDDDFQMVFQRE